MRQNRHLPKLVAFAAVAIAPAAALAQPDSTVTAETTDHRSLTGRLVVDPAGGARFEPATGRPMPLAELARVVLPATPAKPGAALPPFAVELGFGGRVSGRLKALTAEEIRLDDGPSGKPVVVRRSSALSLRQRPGEAAVLREPFDTLDGDRWHPNGEVAIVGDPKSPEGASLRLLAGAAAVTYRPSEPLGSGRLELGYVDGGEQTEDQRWFVDLTFRGRGGTSSIQAVLGWDEDTLAVRSRGGPPLAVQPLIRAPGRHRLVVRFGPGRTDLAVDGDELAHGNGPEGPLVEIRIATEKTGRSAAPKNLGAVVDDVRLSRVAEPINLPEPDPAQDEAFTVGGDQLYGRVVSGDAEGLILEVDGAPSRWSWSDVASLRFRRDPRASESLEGLWLRAEWRVGLGDEPIDRNSAEGTLRAFTAGALELNTLDAGTLTIPRDRLASITVLGRYRRMVLDPSHRHLGNRLDPALEPPQPEGGSCEIAFELKEVPPGAATLVVDAVQVIGESGDPDFSDRVKRGELRTRVLLNGTRFDDLNRHAIGQSDAPVRLRLPIPAGSLRAGRNTIRFEQVGTKDDPTRLDNLGLLGTALEFRTSPEPPPRADAPRP